MPISLPYEASPRSPASDRDYWVRTLTSIERPVLEALAARRLKASMPTRAEDPRIDRSRFAPLEALGRCLCGLAPWLESSPVAPAEAALRGEFAALARAALDAATDPGSPDRVEFDPSLSGKEAFSFQPIVDGAFLAQAILRAPRELWERLDPRVRGNLAAALESSRSRKPMYNNWLLFGAMVEASLHRMGAAWDHMRVDYALRQHEAWYKGDGLYGDGPHFHADYYNSFVIQPMLLDILDAVGDSYPEWRAMREPVRERARRYASILERMIAPDGSFPPLGRSLVYRFGAFQHLSLMALRRDLGEELAPAQVRCALTAVIERSLGRPGNFDGEGWLTKGLCGAQPGLAEPYITTGSLYLCSTAYLALGLPADDPFWTAPAEPWTSVKAWSGLEIPRDQAL